MTAETVKSPVASSDDDLAAVLDTFAFPADMNAATGDPVVRKAVWTACGKHCFYTGRPISLDDMHIDHALPKAHGGPDNLMNYVATCGWANARKRARYDRTALVGLLGYIATVIAPRAKKIIDEERAKAVRKVKAKPSPARRPLSKKQQEALRRQITENARHLLTEIVGDVDIQHWAQLITIPPMPPSQVEIMEHLRGCLLRHPERFVGGDLFNTRDPLTLEEIEARINARESLMVLLADVQGGIPVDMKILGLFGQHAAITKDLDDARCRPELSQMAFHDVIFPGKHANDEVKHHARFRFGSSCLLLGGKAQVPDPGSSANTIIGVSICSSLIRMLALLDPDNIRALFTDGGTVTLSDTHTDLPRNRWSPRPLNSCFPAL